MRIRDRKDFQEVLEATYKRLKSEGEITLSADQIGSTYEHEVLWVNMIQYFPCTMNDAIVALINLRKKGVFKDQAEDESSGEASMSLVESAND